QTSVIGIRRRRLPPTDAPARASSAKSLPGGAFRAASRSAESGDTKRRISHGAGNASNIHHHSSAHTSFAPPSAPGPLRPDPVRAYARELARLLPADRSLGRIRRIEQHAA